MAQINCVVVTPEATTLDETADFVALPLSDGELGVGSGHTPLIGRLGFGELRLRTGGKVERYYVDGGFVQVADNVVSVLTNRAMPVGNLNLADAKKLLDDALKLPTQTDDQQAAQTHAMQQARAQIRLASAAKS